MVAEKRAMTFSGKSCSYKIGNGVSKGVPFGTGSV